MDIVKAFNSNNLHTDITIKGTYEDPLFRASDVGLILDIKFIHNSIKDFDNDEKVSRRTLTLGGPQEVFFLTELGLYRLLGQSRKPIAREFQKWIAKVIKEIRLTGKYELEKQLKEKEEEIKIKNQEIEKISLENERLSVVNNIPVIYIYNTDTRPEVIKPPLKIGATQNYRSRSKPYNQTHPYGKMVFYIEIPSANANLKTVENWIHTILASHLIKGEMFNIDVEEAKKIITLQVCSLNLANNTNVVDRQLKIDKFMDQANKIIYDIPDANISTFNKSIQTDPTIEEINNTNNKLLSNFDKFFNECCVINENLEVSTIDITGQYRIWSQSADKETYLAFLDYLKVKFRPIRLQLQNKENVVNGYKGVSLKEIEYKRTYIDNEPETFIFSNCMFKPGGKTLFSEISTEYLDWKKRNKKGILNYEKELKQFLNECKYIYKSNIWGNTGNGVGYYGISLKSHENINKKQSSSTAKKVQKRDSKTQEILDNWPTIAKAAESENISAAKMSRSIKNNVVFNNSYYYCISTV